MHKVFGTKEDVAYTDRKGAYLIPMQNNKIGVVKTDKGYFLLGGGLDGNESYEECIKRECLEEIGYTVVINEIVCSAETFTTHPKLEYFHPIQSYYIGELKEKVSEPIETDHILMWFKYDDIKGKMFAEMQNWALKQCAEKLKGEELL